MKEEVVVNKSVTQTTERAALRIFDMLVRGDVRRGELRMQIHIQLREESVIVRPGMRSGSDPLTMYSPGWVLDHTYWYVTPFCPAKSKLRELEVCP